MLAALAAAALAACGGGGGGEQAPVTPANEAPSVSIDAPLASASYTSTDSIRIAATASDRDGRVVRVEFLSDGNVIGSDTNAPFEFTWNNPTVGAHTITVRAVDDAGAATLSASRQVTVAAPPPPNQAPTASMAAPANNFKANAPSTVLLSANASDADGSVAKVEFFRIDPAAPVYDASTLVGQATAVGTPPAYQLQTAPLVAGVYNYVARATDDKGATATSASVQVIINALPVVSITAPAAGATVIPGTTLTLRATASDADGSVSKVEFFLDGGASPIGQGVRVGATNEYTLSWTTTVQGSYAFTARATDNDGAQQSTGSVAVNVPANQLPAVTLDDPAAGTNAPTTLSLAASASDADGNVTSVQFFNGATSLGNGSFDAATSKWRLQVPVGAAQFGSYTITARATDNLGGQRTTPSKSVTIAANVPPAVNVTSSAAATLPVGNAPTTLTLAASASDSDGIDKVEFYNGVAKIGDGSLSAGSYQLAWNNVAAGSYSVTAKATDAVGSVTTSAPQTLVVTPNLEAMWDTLSTAQKGGITLTPDRAIAADGGVMAGAVLTAIGINTVAPKFVVAMAQGLRKLADLPLNVTTDYVACPGGGRMRIDFIDADTNFINLDNCTIDGTTFYGGADLPNYVQTYDPMGPETCPPGNQVAGEPTKCSWPINVTYKKTAGGFRILVSSLTVSGYGTPEPLTEPFPHNGYGYGYVECTVNNGAKTCLTNHENSFLWGSDLAWTWSDNGTVYGPLHPLNYYANDDAYTVNGTLRPCQADPQVSNYTPEYCQGQEPAGTPHQPFNRINFQMKFDSMTNVSGRAIVYGSNGWSVVTRLAPIPGDRSATPPTLPVERLTVRSTVGGVQQPQQSFNCTVDSNGFYQCALAP